jgi:broad specificity phosphatase PhoE
MSKVMKIFLLVIGLFSAVTLTGRTVYITRHGQVGDPACKSPNSERGLTPLGVKQARQLGRYLKHKKFSGTIYASPLYRTMHTADLIAEINGCSFAVDPGLQEFAPVFKEINQGKYGICAEGCDGAAVKKYFPRATLSSRFTYPWRLMNEPENMRHERCAKTLDAILDETTGDILLVGHSAIVKSFIFVLSKRADQPIVATPWNCCLITVVLDDQRRVTSWKVETGNFQKPEQITNNFRKPLVPKPGDKRYK